MIATLNPKILLITPLLAACLLQMPSLFAQTKKQSKSETDKDGTIRIRIEKEENGKKKVIERTYRESDLNKSKDSSLTLFSTDSLDLSDIDILTELDMLDEEGLYWPIPHFRESSRQDHRELSKQLRVHADRLTEHPLAPIPPDIDVYMRQFPEVALHPFSLKEMPLRLRNYPMEFDEENYDINEQKTENGRKFIITPKPKERVEMLDRAASVKALRIKPGTECGLFGIQFYLAQKGDVRIVVTNTEGKEVFKDKTKNVEGDFTKSVDLRKRPKGVYFMTITQNNDGVVRRLVIE